MASDAVAAVPGCAWAGVAVVVVLVTELEDVTLCVIVQVAPAGIVPALKPTLVPPLAPPGQRAAAPPPLHETLPAEPLARPAG